MDRGVVEVWVGAWAGGVGWGRGWGRWKHEVENMLCVWGEGGRCECSVGAKGEDKEEISPVVSQPGRGARVAGNFRDISKTQHLFIFSHSSILYAENSIAFFFSLLLPNHHPTCSTEIRK